MAAEYQVGGGFVDARPSQDIRRAEAGALACDKHLPVFRLGDELRAGRDVHDKLRAIERHPVRGRLHDPEVLADFDSEAEAVLRLVDDSRFEGNFPVLEEIWRAIAFRCRAEMPLFVEFAVFRQVAFHREPKQLAILHDCCAIEKPRPLEDGDSRDENGAVSLACGLAQPGQRVKGRVQKRTLLEEVAAAVAGNRQFRKGHKGRARAAGVKIHLTHDEGVR